MENFISSFKNRFVMFCKQFIVSGHSQILCSFIKFNQFLTNRFFVSKIRKYLWKNIMKGFTAKSPSNLIPLFNVFGMAINEMNLPSKPFKTPFDGRYFSVIALKKDFIKPIWTRFSMISSERNTTFGINKTRQISEIHFTRYYSVGQWRQNLLMFFHNKIVVLFNVLNFRNKKLFFIFRSTLDKLTEQFSFQFLFNEKWKDVLNKSKGFFTLKNEMILRFLSNMFLSIGRKPICAMKRFGKIFNNSIIRRRDDKSGLIFDSFGIFNLYFSKIKTSIPISISSYVCKSFVHANNIARSSV